MLDFSKQDAIKAAEHFLDGLARWTDCFFDDTAGARLLKLQEAEYVTGDRYFSEATEAEIQGNFAKVDFSQFTFVRQIEEIYNFAATGSWQGTNVFDDSSASRLGNWLCDSLTEFSSFLHVFEKKPPLSYKDGGTDFLGAVINNREVTDILLDVVTAASARWRLVEGGLDLTLDKIATLAGVSLKTVRNAVSSKGPDRLIASSTEHGNPRVDAEEAYRWLQTKKGFTGPFFLEEMPSYDRYETLGQLQHHCLALRKRAGFEIADLQKQLGWNETITAAYRNLEKPKLDESLALITPAVLLSLGQLYQLERLDTFVVEASRLLGALVAERQANALFQ